MTAVAIDLSAQGRLMIDRFGIAIYEHCSRAMLVNYLISQAGFIKPITSTNPVQFQMEKRIMHQNLE